MWQKGLFDLWGLQPRKMVRAEARAPIIQYLTRVMLRLISENGYSELGGLQARVMVRSILKHPNWDSENFTYAFDIIKTNNLQKYLVVDWNSMPKSKGMFISSFLCFTNFFLCCSIVCVHVYTIIISILKVLLRKDSPELINREIHSYANNNGNSSKRLFKSIVNTNNGYNEQ